MTPRLPAPPAPNPGRNISRLFISIMAILLAALATFALIRVGVFYSIYASVLGKVVEQTGLDIWASRAIALALVAFLWFLPWHLFIVPWLGGAKRQVAPLLAITALTFAAMEFVTQDVYFSRTDGHPLKYYIQTLDGYKLAASPGTDPVYGIPYKPITTEVANTYILWKRRGGRIQDPSVPEGRYFSANTGEPLRWYAKLPDGSIEMFTLPGFHPTYGTKLLPATLQIATEHEKQKAEAERQRQAEARKNQERAEREAKRQARIQAARKAKEEADRQARDAERMLQPLQPGRYLFSDPCPSGIIGGFRFTLSEVDLIADKILVHLGVENIGVDPKTEHPPRSIRLALVTQEGMPIAYAAIRAKEGAVMDHTAAGIYFPSVGQRGAFVMEFQRPEPLGTFSIAVNDQPLLGAINLRQAAFQSF